ncbi:hypothetical protein L208DRAFT_1376534 [Tricholoma matsutake]|nr:hypothetical protein L208DRAFT_1376534 [Tricholoma matsutake 945]
MKQYMPVNSFHEVSKLLRIVNKVFQELNQPDEPIFALCDEGIDIGDVVQDEDIQSMVPGFPDINIGCDILSRRLVFFAVGTNFMVHYSGVCRGMMGKGLGTGTFVGINSIKEGPGMGWEFDIDSVEVHKYIYPQICKPYRGFFNI